MGTLRLTVKIFPLTYVYLLFPAHARIDGGETQKVSWGTTEMELPVGTHQLEVSFRYMFIFPVRASSIELTVQDGQTTSIRYRAPFWWFLSKGKLEHA